MKGKYNDLNKLRKEIEVFQSNEYYHSLTCGNNSHHLDLVPQLEKDNNEFELFLACEECNWKQDVPVFFTFKE